MMYLVRENTKLHIPSEVSYYSHVFHFAGVQTVLLRGFPSACLFQLKKDAVAARQRWVSGMSYPETIEVVKLTDIKPPEGFKDCRPLAADSIPPKGQEIEIVYRDGSRCGAAGDFVRNELLTGTWSKHPEFARWRPVEKR